MDIQSAMALAGKSDIGSLKHPLIDDLKDDFMAFLGAMMDAEDGLESEDLRQCIVDMIEKVATIARESSPEDVAKFARMISTVIFASASLAKKESEKPNAQVPEEASKGIEEARKEEAHSIGREDGTNQEGKDSIPSGESDSGTIGGMESVSTDSGIGPTVESGK